MSENSESRDMLVLQQFETIDGMKHIIWRVPCKEFLMGVRHREAMGMTINKAKIATLKEFYEKQDAEYVGITDQDAELFAANLREEGVDAKYCKGMKDVPEQYFEEEE